MRAAIEFSVQNNSSTHAGAKGHHEKILELASCTVQRFTKGCCVSVIVDKNWKRQLFMLLKIVLEIVAQRDNTPPWKVRRIAQRSCIGIDRPGSSQSDSGTIAGIQSERGPKVEIINNFSKLGNNPCRA